MPEEKTINVSDASSADEERAQWLANMTAESVAEVVIRAASSLNSLGLDTLRRVLAERPDLLNACTYCTEWDPLDCGGCMHIADEALLDIARGTRPVSTDEVIPTVVERLDAASAWCQEVKDERALNGF